MSPQFRKVALTAASLGLLLSLFLALRPSDDEDVVPTTTVVTTTAPAETETAPAATTEPAATTTAPAAPEVVTINIVVGPEGVASVRRFSVQRGRDVELIVTSELADEVHLHGYDLTADVAPGSPATIEFTADTAGIFEIELEDRGLEIGELEVRP